MPNAPPLPATCTALAWCCWRRGWGAASAVGQGCRHAPGRRSRAQHCSAARCPRAALSCRHGLHPSLPHGPPVCLCGTCSTMLADLSQRLRCPPAADDVAAALGWCGRLCHSTHGAQGQPAGCAAPRRVAGPGRRCLHRPGCVLPTHEVSMHCRRCGLAAAAHGSGASHLSLPDGSARCIAGGASLRTRRVSSR